MQGTESSGKVRVTVVMPCLNEAETLAQCIDAARTGIAALGEPGEVVVADNGSTDGSIELAQAHGARVVPVPQRGYGAALDGGIRAAAGDYVVMADADMSYDFTQLRPFVDALDEGADLVVGNRFRGGIAPNAMPPLHRYLGNPVLSFIGRLFFRVPIGDFHCGMRAVRRSRYEDLNLHTLGMEYASEMIVSAALRDFRIAEVPTTLSPDGRSRPPHLRTWRDGWRHLRFLLLYSPRWLFLYPGAALTLIGLALMLWLLPDERKVGSVGLDVQTLVYAGGAVIVGYQAVLFSVLARSFAVSEGLLPPSRRWHGLLRRIRLETGLLAGVALLLVGLGVATWAFVDWANSGYGHLDPASSLRRAIPAMCALALGSETLLASFLISLLNLRRRGPAVAPQPAGDG